MIKNKKYYHILNQIYTGSAVNLSLISNCSSFFSIFSLNLVNLPLFFCFFLVLIIGISINIKEKQQQTKINILNKI